MIEEVLYSSRRTIALSDKALTNYRYINVSSISLYISVYIESLFKLKKDKKYQFSNSRFFFEHKCYCLYMRSNLV